MCNFNKDDVIKLAKAITDNPVLYMDCDSNPYYYCEYCEAELVIYDGNREDFKHELTCPVLFAQDILTGCD